MTILKSQVTRATMAICLSFLTERALCGDQGSNFPKKVVMAGCDQQIEITVGETTSLPLSIKFPNSDSFNRLNKSTIIPGWLMRNGQIGTMSVTSIDEDRMSCVQIKSNQSNNSSPSFIVNPKTGQLEDVESCFSLVEKSILNERKQFLDYGVTELSKRFAGFSFVKDEIILSPYGSLLVAFNNVESKLAVFDFKKLSLINQSQIKHGTIDRLAFEAGQKWLRIISLNRRGSYNDNFLPLDRDNLSLRDKNGNFLGYNPIINGRYAVAYYISDSEPASLDLYVYDLKNSANNCSKASISVAPASYRLANYNSTQSSKNEADAYYVLKNDTGSQESDKITSIHMQIK